MDSRTPVTSIRGLVVERYAWVMDVAGLSFAGPLWVRLTCVAGGVAKVRVLNVAKLWVPRGQDVLRSCARHLVSRRMADVALGGTRERSAGTSSPVGRTFQLGGPDEL